VKSGDKFLGACYDAMHNREYPLNGAPLDIGALTRAIDNDFNQMSQYVRHVRTFYSNFFGIPVAFYAAKYGVKLYLGVFMTDEAWYQDQVQAAVNAVRDQPGTVSAIFIGNENLRPNGPYSADQIIARINQLRDQIKASTGRSVPVGTVQRITEWLNQGIRSETSRLADACDIIGVNIYPFFGQYDFSNPIRPLEQQWNAMVSQYGTAKVRLTETGLPSAGGPSPTGVPADLQIQMSYYNAVANWKPNGQGPAFWFAFHDRRNDDNSIPGAFEKHFGLVFANGAPKANNFPPKL
jgi:exo-beta-1,3-glucanase (GH17 family)